MAEKVAEGKKYGSLADIPRELSGFLCWQLNDHLVTEELNKLYYLFNLTLDKNKLPSDLIHELSSQRKVNCHLLIRSMSIIGRYDLSKKITNLLNTEENMAFSEEDSKDKQFIENELNQRDGVCLSRKSIEFRFLVVDIFVNHNFDKQQVDSMKMGFGLPAVRMAACKNLLEMFLEAERKPEVHKSPSDTIKFLIDVLGFNKKAVERVWKFRNENSQFFS